MNENTIIRAALAAMIITVISAVYLSALFLEGCPA